MDGWLEEGVWMSNKKCTGEFEWLVVVFRKSLVLIIGLKENGFRLLNGQMFSYLCVTVSVAIDSS